MGEGFIEWFLGNLLKYQESYLILSKVFKIHLDYYKKELGYNNYDSFIRSIELIFTSGDETLKNEFYKFVSGMEKTLNKTKGDVRRILGMWNGVDFAQYNKGISGINESTSVSGLLRYGKKEIAGDDIKTLGEELNQDIEFISIRIYELLGRKTIKDGVIIDDSIGLFSSLDGFLSIFL